MEAQDAAYWHFSVGAGIGTHQDFRFSADFILPSQLSLCGSLQALQCSSPETPADYEEGLCIWDDCQPRIKTTTYGVLAGRVVGLSRFFRLNLRGGLAIHDTETPVNFRRIPPDPFHLSSNYQYDKKRSTNVGMLLEPRLEFLPSRAWGLGLGVFAHVNQTNPAFGVFLELFGGRYLRAY